MRQVDGQAGADSEAVASGLHLFAARRRRRLGLSAPGLGRRVLGRCGGGEGGAENLSGGREGGGARLALGAREAKSDYRLLAAIRLRRRVLLAAAARGLRRARARRPLSCRARAPAVIRAKSLDALAGGSALRTPACGFPRDWSPSIACLRFFRGSPPPPTKCS